MSGVGRGAILRKMMDSTQSCDGDNSPSIQPPRNTGIIAAFGRGTSLMTPSQFMKSATAKKGTSTTKPVVQGSGAILACNIDCEENNNMLNILSLGADDNDLKAPSQPGITTPEENPLIQFIENNKDNVSDIKAHLDAKIDKSDLNTGTNLDLNKSKSTEENLSTNKQQIKKDEDEHITLTTSNITSDDSDDFFSIPEQKPLTLLNKEVVTLPQADMMESRSGAESKDKKVERSEDEKWKFYQIERKINKVIKSITLDNLGEMFEELERLVEERPLSSCYINCSEVQILLEALMTNAVQNTEFLPLAPCLIKMVSEHQPIEFKQYFPELCDAKCKESVSLSASDEYLNKSGKQFCKLLGHLFAMPRQTGPILFNIISTIVGDYVEKWTCPEGSEVKGDGLQEYRLLIEATAARYLLLEITQKMLSCDRQVETEMEKYVWFMRESVLNVDVPRKVREIYLDGLIEIQTTSGDESSTSVSNYGLFAGPNSQSESEADNYFETDTGTEDDLVKVENSCTDVLNTKSEEIKTNIEFSLPSSKKGNADQFDFKTLENPPINTIAMAPRIENAYDSSAQVPKSVKPKIAMTFSNQSVVRKHSQEFDDNDADVIIEDECVNVDEQFDDSVGNVNNTHIDIDDFFVSTKSINKSVNSNPFVPSLPPKKKLPMGRGRGLAKLPDLSDSRFSEKPVANVGPFDYSSCESTNRNRNRNAMQDSEDAKIRVTDSVRPRCGGVANNDSPLDQFLINNEGRGESFNHQRGGSFNNDPRGEHFHRRRGGGSNNDMRTDNFQNQRGGGSNNDWRNDNFQNQRGGGFNNDCRTDNFQNQRGGGNRGNHQNKNNRRFRNDNQKQRKTNFRPMYHKKNTNNRDDQFTQNHPADMMMGQPKTEMEKFYHPNGRLEYKVKTPQKHEFGSVMPRSCLRCNSNDHVSEECPEDNLFF